MSVSQSLGGIPAIAAAVVVVVGILGALAGYPLLVLIQEQIEPEQQADDDRGGDQHRIDDGPRQAAVEGPGHEIEGQGEGQGEPEDHGLFIL